jgi:hypothetical protein
MPIEWTISYGARLVLAVAKGELASDRIRDFLAAIDAAGARPYRKIVDITGLSTRFDADAIAAFAGAIREREVASAVGPVAIVAGTGPTAEQARAFAARAQLLRPIRVFAELHEARQWLDKLPDEPVDPRAIAGRAPLPPMKLE